MTFMKYKELIEEGDTVIVYVSFDSMSILQLHSGKVHQTKYGALKHDDVIGKKFGRRVNCSQGFIHVLYPTPELWTVTLPHRTQILYSTDISMVIYQLDLKPGSTLIESGTGSGSVSHALIRTVAPNGHLYTFDFHEQRAQKAREEFQQHGMSANVTVIHRDVCKDGFGLGKRVDAVFLDLPSPWVAVEYAKNALKFGGRICSFSPCIEQVQRTYTELEKKGFSDLLTRECLLRTFTMKEVNLPRVPTTEDEDETLHFTTALTPQIMPGHTGFLTFASLFPA